MKLTFNSTVRLDKHKMGCLLAYIYIITSYIAQDLFLSSSINSLCLYAFLAFSAYIFVSKFGARQAVTVFSFWQILFFVISVAMISYSPNASRVMDSLYAMFVSLCLCLFLQLYIKGDLEFSKIAWCYAISGFAFVVILFLTGNLKGDAGNRLGVAVLGNANLFASMMMIAVLYTMWLFVYRAPRRTYKIMLLIMIVFDMYALALSGGRKFFVVPFIFFYMLLLLKTNKQGRRNVLGYTVLFGVIVAVAWLVIMNVAPIYNAIGVRMEGLINNLKGEGGDVSADIREVIRQLAFERWTEHPLFGHGFDSFKFLAETAVGRFYYSHCNYAELLYNGGIIYFVLYYWIYGRILYNALQNKRIPEMYKAFAIAVVVSQLVFDYGAVTYESKSTGVLLMMAYHASLFVEKENEDNG